MAIYDLGTASLAENGEVTGVGTTWKAPLTLIRVGATIVFKTEPVQIYTISEIISDTKINVYNPNSETVPAGTGYAILAHDGITVQGLAQDVAETLRYYQSRETEVADAVDAFSNFDSADFESKVTQVNTQHGDVVSIGAQVSTDAAQVSSDKDAAAASASSASYDKDAAAASALEAAGYAASLDTQNLLRKDLAFSDLNDKSLARQNLDVYSKSGSCGVFNIIDEVNFSNASDGDLFYIDHITSLDDVAGGLFVFRSSTPKSSHDGGVIIDPEISRSSLQEFLYPSSLNVGAGVIERVWVEDLISCEWFGARHSSTGFDSYPPIQKCVEFSNVAGVGKTAYFHSSYIVTKPIVVTSQTSIKGASRYKSFIIKTGTQTSGLPAMSKPSDAIGSAESVPFDVDAVVIIKPFNSGEYATYINISDLTIENNSNSQLSPKPDGVYGVYAPFMNLSKFERFQVYNVDYALYSNTMWMININQWRAYNVNHNIAVTNGGTSLVFQNVWCQDCYYGAYYFKGVGYCNLLQVSADKLGVGESSFGGFAYRFVDCQNIEANLSVEESDNYGVIAIENSTLNLQIQALYGVRGGTSSTDSLVAIVNSRVDITNSDFAVSDQGTLVNAYYYNSKITIRNSPSFNLRDKIVDTGTSIINISDSISVSGLTASSTYQNSIGGDVSLCGSWDSSGRLVFKSPSGDVVYGTLFANSANQLRWVPGGYPQNNSDGNLIS